MEEVLYTFEAVHHKDETTLWLAIIIALGALAGMILLLRKSGDRNRRNQSLLIAMLLFFVFLIAGSTAFFSNLFMTKLGTVKLYSNAVETSYGKVMYTDIRNAYIHLDKQPSIINPVITRKSTRMLMIEEKDGNVHVLPEENYPIQEILARMKEVIEE